MSLRKEQDFPEINPTDELKFKHLCFGLGGGGAGSTGGQGNDGGAGEGGMGDVGDAGDADPGMGSGFGLGVDMGVFGGVTANQSLAEAMGFNSGFGLGTDGGSAFGGVTNNSTLGDIFSSQTRSGSLGSALDTILGRIPAQFVNDVHLSYANPIARGLDIATTLSQLTNLVNPNLVSKISTKVVDSLRAKTPGYQTIGDITEGMFSEQTEPGSSDGGEITPHTATTSVLGATGENQLASVYDNSGMAETIDETAQISPEFLASIMQNRTAAPLINNATYGDEENPTLLDYVRTHMGFV